MSDTLYYRVSACPCEPVCWQPATASHAGDSRQVWYHVAVRLPVPQIKLCRRTLDAFVYYTTLASAEKTMDSLNKTTVLSMEVKLTN